ncbi:MAG: MlaD family protein, partial [Planctomycetota bacterium]
MEVISLAAKIRAGLMVILLIALSLYTIEILSPEKEGQVYLIYFEDSVAGLEENASVLYNGIQIGFVLSIEPFPTNFGMLNRVKIRVTSESKVLKICKDADNIDYLILDSFNEVGDDVFVNENKKKLDLKKNNYSLIQVNTKAVHTQQDFNRCMAEIINTSNRTKKFEPYTLTFKNETEQNFIVDSSKGKLLLTFKEPDSLEKGTRAALGQNFVTGLKWVDLSGGNTNLLELVGSTSEEDVSDKHQILSEAGFFSKLMSEKNIKRFENLINNVESTLGNVAEITSEVKTHLPDIVKRAKEFISKEGELGLFMNNLNETLDSAEKLWLEGGVFYGTLEDGQKMINELRAQVKDGKVYELLTNTNEMIKKVIELTTKKDLWLIQTTEEYK